MAKKMNLTKKQNSEFQFGQREYYYTLEEYDASGVKRLIEHIKEYAKFKRTVPVMRTSSGLKENLYFTLSDPLYRLFITKLDRIKKPYECALKYGFRGYSKGGKNGIFIIRKEDDSLRLAIDNLVREYENIIIQDLDCNLSDISRLRKVKIVYHDPSGERLVGVMNEKNNRVFFLGFANY